MNLVRCNLPGGIKTKVILFSGVISLQNHPSGVEVLCRVHPDQGKLPEFMGEDEQESDSQVEINKSLVWNICLELLKKEEWEASVAGRRVNSDSVQRKGRLKRVARDGKVT